MKNLPQNCLDGRHDIKTNTSIRLISIKFIYSGKHFNGQLMCDIRLKTSDCLDCMFSEADLGLLQHPRWSAL